MRMALRLSIDQGIPMGLVGPKARVDGRVIRGHQMARRARVFSGRIIGLARSQMQEHRQLSMTLEEVDGVSHSTPTTARHPHRMTGTAGEVVMVRLGGLAFSTVRRNRRGGRKALPGPWRSKGGGNGNMRGRKIWSMRVNKTWSMRVSKTWFLVGISTS